MALTSLAVAGLVIAPVQAKADNSRCPTNRFCLFKGTNFNGGRSVFGTTDRFLGDNRYDTGGSVANIASSMINNTGHQVVLFDVSCSGITYGARPHSEDSTFTNNNFNDKAECLVFI